MTSPDHPSPEQPRPDHQTGTRAALAPDADVREALAARARQQAAVAAFGVRALGNTDLRALMQDAVETVSRTLGNEFVKVLELLPDGSAVRLVAGVGWREGLVGRATVGVGLDSQAGYTLQSSEPVVVEDLRTETRFSGPALLHDHGVVSGMSVIIHGAGGRACGVLGTHTARRHAFTRDDLHFLQAVANVLGAAAQRRHVEAAVRESEARYRIAAEVARLGTWTWDPVTDAATFDARVRELFGFESDEPWPRVSILATRVHPDDRARVEAALARAADAAGDGGYQAEFRVVRPDGSERWARAAGQMRFEGGDDAPRRPVFLLGTAQDVTDEHARAAELEARTAVLESVLRQLPVGVIIAEAPSGRLMMSNAESESIWRHPPRPANAVGDYRAYPGFHPEDGRPYAPDEWPLARAVQRGEAVAGEMIDFRRGDGTLGTMRASAAPVHDAAGRVTSGVVVFEDMTPQREAAAAERAMLQAVILNTPAPLSLLVGPEHRFDLVNEAYKRVSGGGRDVTGLTPPEAFPELAGSGIYELFDHVYATGESWDSPETLVRYDRDGTGVRDTWFNLRFEPLRNREGRVYAILNFAVDVTDQVVARREVERLLAESEAARGDAEASRARSEAVLTSIADAFYLLDREWRFVYVNDAAEPLLRTTRERLLGRTLWDAFPEVAGSPFEAPYREAMGAGRVTAAEAYFEPLGTWFDVRTYPWPGGLMVHFRDIGARKAAEAERERLLADAETSRTEAEAARRVAEVANRAKTEFLAVMSHELRTPLNAIGGYAQLMELGIRGPMTDAQLEDLRRIQVSQRHLLGLVNDVLNYARVETGALSYDSVEVPLADVIAGVEPLVALQLADKGITYSHDDGGDAALVARADPEKVRQILLNLLTNAVKFTDAGGRVTVSCGLANDAGDRVALRVSDSGIGIAPADLGRIFDPFVQVNAKLTRTQDGAGLGLAISRDLARGMGGDLTAESTPGVGSTFALTLPRA